MSDLQIDSDIVNVIQKVLMLCNIIMALSDDIDIVYHRAKQ